MAEQLISQFLDLPALKGQAEEFVLLLKSIQEQYQNLGSARVNLNIAKSFKDTTTAINEVSTATKSAEQSTRDLARAALDAAAQRKADASAALAELRLQQEQQKQVAAQQKKDAADAEVARRKAFDEQRAQNVERVAMLKKEQEQQEILEAAEKKRSDAEKGRLANGPFTGQTNQSSSAQPTGSTGAAAVEATELEQLAASVNATKASLADLATEQKELDAAFADGTIVQTEYTLASARNLLTQTELKATLSAQQKELQNTVRIQNEATGSLNEQRAALALLNAEYALLSTTEKASAEGVALQTRITGNTAALLAEEKQLGQSQRDVGNYGAGWDKAGKQLSKFTDVGQIAATTISRLFRTFVGFFIISQIFEVLRAAGEKLSAVIEAIRAPLGSLNDTLKKNAEAIAGTKATYESAVVSVDNLKEHIRLSKEGFIDQDKVVKEYNDTIGKTVGSANSLAEVEAKLVQEGDNYIKFTLYKAAATVALGKAAEQAFLAEQARQKQAKEFVGAGTSFAANAATGSEFSADFRPGKTDNAAIANAQIIAAQRAKEKVIKDAQEQEDALEKIAKDFNDKAKQFGFNWLPDPDAGKTRTTAEKAKNFLVKTSDEYLKYVIDVEKQLSESVEIGESTRLAFRQDAAAKELALDVKDRNDKLAAARLKLSDALQNATDLVSAANSKEKKKAQAKADIDTSNAQKEFNATVGTINSAFIEHQKVEAIKFQADLFQIQATGHAQRLKEDKEANEIFEAEEKARHDARIKLQQNNAADRSTITSTTRDDELDLLNKSYKARKISTEQYQLEKYKIEKKFEIQATQDLVDNAQFLIDHAKDYGTDVLAQENKIAEARIKLSKQLTDELIANEDKLRDERKKITAEIVAGVGELVDDGYDKQKNAIQEQIDLIGTQKEAELSAVDSSTASAADKAEQIALINARADDQQKSLEKRQKDEDVKKAEFDKVIAEIQIEQQTQQAIQGLTLKAAQARAEGALLAANPVTASYASIAYASAASIAAQIPIVIAEGIISAALVAAKPIPRYKHGVINAPGGPSLLGDGGVHEVLETSDGTAYLTPNTDTLVDIPEGSNVYSDIHKYLYKKLGPGKSTNDSAAVEVVANLKILQQDVRNIKQTSNKATIMGLVYSQQMGAKWSEYVNRNIRW